MPLTLLSLRGTAGGSGRGNTGRMSAQLFEDTNTSHPQPPGKRPHCHFKGAHSCGSLVRVNLASAGNNTLHLPFFSPISVCGCILLGDIIHVDLITLTLTKELFKVMKTYFTEALTWLAEHMSMPSQKREGSVLHCCSRFEWAKLHKNTFLMFLS